MDGMLLSAHSSMPLEESAFVFADNNWAGVRFFPRLLPGNMVESSL